MAYYHVVAMSILSKRLLKGVARSYAREFGVRPALLLPGGRIAEPTRGDVMHDLPVIQQARAHALEESLRWGEPYVFFLAPGIVSSVIPLVRDEEAVGGLTGGEVMAEDDPEDRREAVTYLTAAGCPRRKAVATVSRLPVWPQARTQEAADALYALFYRMSGWTPTLLTARREEALQQRQIAEEIHRRKFTRDVTYPLDDERLLLSLIRAGDRRGARRLLNRMLGAVFLRTADVTVVRALMIELMGYLVRAAVEDSPYLAPLLDKNHAWMARTIAAPDFEALSRVLRDALDDFMDNIYLMGYQPQHAAVRRALEYIAAHFAEPVAVDDVARAAGLSASRVAHLVKQHTGHSILQHVHRMRIREAQRLLERTTRSCAAIAYQVGFGDQSYFTRQFRLLTGTTPGRHRRRSRAR